MHSEKFSSTWQVINMIMIILAALFEYNWCELVRIAVNARVMYWPGRGCTVNIYSASCGPGTQKEQNDAAHPILLQFRYNQFVILGEFLHFDLIVLNFTAILHWTAGGGQPVCQVGFHWQLSPLQSALALSSALQHNAVKKNNVFFSCSLILLHGSFATKFSTTTVIQSVYKLNFQKRSEIYWLIL